MSFWKYIFKPVRVVPALETAQAIKTSFDVGRKIGTAIDAKTHASARLADAAFKRFGPAPKGLIAATDRAVGAYRDFRLVPAIDAGKALKTSFDIGRKIGTAIDAKTHASTRLSDAAYKRFGPAPKGLIAATDRAVGAYRAVRAVSPARILPPVWRAPSAFRPPLPRPVRIQPTPVFRPAIRWTQPRPGPARLATPSQAGFRAPLRPAQPVQAARPMPIRRPTPAVRGFRK
jgi:hypothetical protein